MGTIESSVKALAMAGDEVAQRLWLIDELTECIDELHRAERHLYPTERFIAKMGPSGEWRKPSPSYHEAQRSFQAAARELFDVGSCLAQWQYSDDALRVVAQEVEAYASPWASDRLIFSLLHSSEFVWKVAGLEVTSGRSYRKWVKRRRVQGREPLDPRHVHAGLRRLGEFFTVSFS
jgi:hypothetical protein